MARITVEDCLNKVNNRFALIHMAAKRVRQLRKGAEPTIISKNKDIVVSLREIAAAHITKSEKPQENHLIEDKGDSLLPDEAQEKASDSEENKDERASEGH
jgi:DNA-directed RNA polymerase subunit omega